MYANRVHQSSASQSEQLEDAARRQLVARVAGDDLLEILVIGVDAVQSTVHVCGELDVSTAGVLAATLDRELKQGRRCVRLDLSQLSFIDCFGLRVLLRAHRQFFAVQGTVVLTDLSPQAERLLALTDSDEILLVAVIVPLSSDLDLWPASATRDVNGRLMTKASSRTSKCVGAGCWGKAQGRLSSESQGAGRS